MKQIPNLFTLLNLVCGCIAIVFIMQENLFLLPVDSQGNPLDIPSQQDYIPEKIVLGALFIGIAGVIDFLDGFVARLFKVSSELGKQLDSLSDVVSFCVAPGMIVYHFLRLSYAQHVGGLDTSFIWLLPAFIIPCAGAYRLGKFNIDPGQAYGFRGMPTPAVGILIASFPLIYWYADQMWVVELFLNKWFWYGFIVLVSYLMVSSLPLLSLKFKDLSIQNNLPKIILAIITIVAAILLKWMAVPAVFIAYILVSLAFKNKAA